MPTIEEWETALTCKRNIIVKSDETLAKEVGAKPKSKTFTGEPKKIEPITLENHGLSEEGVEITPVDLLYAIGKITTPRIDNIVDLCSTWARIRYLWAFNPAPGPSNRLCLSKNATNIDFHQKGLLSDEIGIGMGDLIVERFFHGKNPIDVEIALESPDDFKIKKKYQTSPDYIFEKGKNEYLVVECKGTQSGHEASLAQLKRGTEQVPSIESGDASVKVTTLVIATELSPKDITKVNIIDPPANPRPSGASSGSDRRKGKIDADGLFRSALVNAQRANLYIYAGAIPNAVKYMRPGSERWKILEKSGAFPDLSQRQTFPELGKEEYVGVTFSTSLFGDPAKIRIFQGMPADIYLSLGNGEDLAEFQNQAAQYREKISKTARVISPAANQQETPNLVISDRNGDTLLISVIGQDGTMLRLEIGS